jgi:hypothetical protein
VSIGLRAQFNGLLFGRGIAQEVAPANLRAGRILEQVGPAQRGMKFGAEADAIILPKS